MRRTGSHTESLTESHTESQTAPARIFAVLPLVVALLVEVTVFQLHFWAGLIGAGEGRPFVFSIVRWLILVCICYACYAFRPSSKLYRMGMAQGGAALAIAIVVIALHAATFAIIPLHYADDPHFTAGYTRWSGAVYDDAQQYAYLANALLEGHTYLDLPVPDYMLGMDNPYNSEDRFALAWETGEPTYWDYAYYDGHYYCYFGILPALLLFVPFKLVTGADLQTFWAVGFSAALLCVAIAVFLRVFLRRYFPRTSLGIYLLMFMLFAMGSGALTQVFYPLFYSLPPLWSLVLLLFGFAALVAAKQDGGLRIGMLVGGSLCIALTLACRPQVFLFVLLVLPLFWKEIVSERLFFSRKGLANTCAIFVPCLVVGVLCMVYNDVRFGSPLEFGAQYNLTYNDLTNKGVPDIDLAGYALTFYILMPLGLKDEFPYFLAHDWHPTTVEPFYGGFFAFNPACVAILALPLRRASLKKKGLWGLCLLGLLIAVVLMVIDVWVSSISMRYMSDFCLGILIPALCAWCSLLGSAKSPRARWVLRLVLVIAVAFGEITGYFSLLGIERYGALISANPTFYGIVEQLFSI